MKKLSIVLVSAFILLAGCSGPSGSSNANQSKSPQQAASSGNGGATNSASSAAGTFPLSKDKVTLKVFAVKSPFVQDYTTNEFTKWYEEKTNVAVNWQFATPQEAQQKLNLALSSNDLPDVIMGFGVTPAQQLVYGQAGVFLPLNDLIDKYGVETKKIFEKYPEIKQATTAPNGKMYSLSSIDGNPHTMLPQKMWINTAWLKKLNLPMPQTTDDLYKVLKAFKTQDPNGNGKADEIPLTGGIQDLSTDITSFIMNAFILNDISSNHMVLDNGKIDVAFNKPAWKEGLQFLNKLYSEGLIAPESFTQNNDQLKAMVEGGDERVGAISSIIPQIFSNIQGTRWLDYKTVPALKGPAGVQQSPYGYYKFTGGNFVITKVTKYPDIAFRWADALYNDDITLRANIGTEGVGWKKPANGETGLNGKPANWIRLLAFGTPQNNNWMQTTIYHFSREMFEGLAAGPNEVPHILYEETAKNYEPYKSKKEQMVPPVFFDESQAAELATLQKTIGDYVKQMTTRFILGDASLDKDWDKYVKTLDSMNLSRYLQIYNDAYNAQYSKK